VKRHRCPRDCRQLRGPARGHPLGCLGLNGDCRELPLGVRMPAADPVGQQLLVTMLPLVAPVVMRPLWVEGLNPLPRIPRDFPRQAAAWNRQNRQRGMSI